MDAYWIAWLPRLLRDRIVGRVNLQRILGNSTWLVADRVVRMGVGLLVGVWIARYLGPAQFGMLGYAMAFVDLLCTFARLGLDSIVVHDLVRKPDQSLETLGSSFVLRLLGGVITLVVAAAGIFQLRPQEHVLHTLVIITATSLVFQSFDVVDFWFQSRVLGRQVVLARNFAFLSIAVVKVILVLRGATVVAFAWTGLAESALAAAGLALSYRLSGGRMLQWQPTGIRARALLRDSWPLILSGLAVTVYMRVDQVMLGQMLDDTAVGLYAAATRISEVWYFIPAALVTSSFPAIVEARNSDGRAYASRLRQLFGLLGGMALVIAGPMSLGSTRIVKFLFGAAFAPAAPILAVHIWCSLFVFWGLAQGAWFIAEGLTRLSLLRTVAAAVLKIALNLLLIPRWQGLGAAIASLVSYSYAAYASNALDPRTRPLFRSQTVSLFLLPRALFRWYRAGTIASP